MNPNNFKSQFIDFPYSGNADNIVSIKASAITAILPLINSKSIIQTISGNYFEIPLTRTVILALINNHENPNAQLD